MRIISLTSIPSRFNHIGLTLESLLAQKVDFLNLYIPWSYHRFPDWNGTLPSVPNGVSIRRCNIDHGPATKILPAAQEYRDTDAQILFCDDDCIVPKGWADRIFAIQSRRHSQVVAYYGRRSYPFHHAEVGIRNAFDLKEKLDIRYRLLRLLSKSFGLEAPFKRPVYKSGFVDVFFGAAGVVVRPQFFDPLSYAIPSIAWLVDDIWLSATMARQSIPIYVPAFGAIPKTLSSSATDALCNLQANGQSRKQLNISASNYCRLTFGVW
jgi:hypothetical protein